MFILTGSFCLSNHLESTRSITRPPTLSLVRITTWGSIAMLLQLKKYVVAFCVSVLCWLTVWFVLLIVVVAGPVEDLAAVAANPREIDVTWRPSSRNFFTGLTFVVSYTDQQNTMMVRSLQTHKETDIETFIWCNNGTLLWDSMFIWLWDATFCFQSITFTKE